MVIKVKTKGIQGRRTKSAKVETNDPRSPRINLQVAFLSEAPVDVYPRPMVNLTGFAGETATAELVLHRTDGQPLEIKQALCTREGVEVTLTEVTGKNADPPNKNRGARAGDWRVTLTLTNTGKPRNEAGHLKIQTNHPQRAEMKIPLRIRVRSTVEFQPGQVQIRASEGAVPVSRTVSLRNGKRKLFNILQFKVEGSLPGVGVTRVREVPSSIHQFRVTVDPKQASPGVYRGKLVATTDLEGYEEVTVPIRVTVTAAHKPKPARAVPPKTPEVVKTANPD